ncbi:hypothetical protein T484DRAFT_1777800 [Baffinella frigidus]|nr:hypothetical protein T484DRAFT_1777800 [Cryptophyta sp. CCMP2293]
MRIALLLLVVPAAAFIPAGLPPGLAPARAAASLAPSALCRPRFSVPKHSLRGGTLAASGARMSAASEMQAKIDALLQTAPPPGPPSVPPSPEAVAIRKEAAGMYATLIALCAEDAPMQIKARNDLGKCLNDAGDLPGAIAVFEKARDDASAKGLHAMECKALMGLSFATARSRDLPGGIALMRQVLQVAEKLDAEGQDGRLEMELVALGHLSVLTVMGKQFDDATEVVARLCAAGKTDDCEWD